MTTQPKYEIEQIILKQLSAVFEQVRDGKHVFKINQMVEVADFFGKYYKDILSNYAGSKILDDQLIELLQTLCDAIKNLKLYMELNKHPEMDKILQPAVYSFERYVSRQYHAFIKAGAKLTQIPLVSPILDAINTCEDIPKYWRVASARDKVGMALGAILILGAVALTIAAFCSPAIAASPLIAASIISASLVLGRMIFAQSLTNPKQNLADVELYKNTMKNIDNMQKETDDLLNALKVKNENKPKPYLRKNDAIKWKPYAHPNTDDVDVIMYPAEKPKKT